MDPPDDGPTVKPLDKRARPDLTPGQRALALLVRREHSRKELTRKLVARGLTVDVVRATVERLSAEGWQDDGRFAEQLVRSRAGNGYGPLRIRAELGTHGLDRDVIAGAIDAFDCDWTRLARDLACRRFAGRFDDREVRRKAAEFLIRRGFTADQVRSATRFDPEDD
ncbi:MAG: regulatory protein RecX [Lysobacteraceae bacterium]|nr:MAG: regulatory protein RecX [Xanthomonadaceae bacterium]